MLIALIVVAALAIGLLVILVMARSSAAEFRAQSEARETALVAERDKLTLNNAELGRDLTATRTEIDQLNTEAGKRNATIQTLQTEIGAAQTSAAEQKARIEGQSAEIAALVSDNNALHERAEAADAARAEAQAEAEAAEARNAGVVIGDVAGVDGSHPAALWDLEVARSERTWRTSVAVDPMAPQGPFETADDPVRLAVEIEAAALRENVGAFITIDWQAAPIEDPARRHLVVRVAQEMLEAAARNPEPLRLVSSGDADVRLKLEPAEDDSSVINLEAPALADDLIEVDTDAGLSVTVKAE